MCVGPKVGKMWYELVVGVRSGVWGVVKKGDPGEGVSANE